MLGQVTAGLRLFCMFCWVNPWFDYGYLACLVGPGQVLTATFRHVQLGQVMEGHVLWLY